MRLHEFFVMVVASSAISGCQPSSQAPASKAPDAALVTIDAGTSGAVATVATPVPAASSAAPARSGAIGRRDIYCGAYESSGRENCHLRVAVVEKDASECERAGSIAGECRTYVAGVTGDASACTRSTEPRDVFECFIAAAVRANDESVCAPLKDGASLEATCSRAGEPRERCALWHGATAANAVRACVAVAKADRAACDALSADDSSRRTCLHAVALKTKDRAVCKALHDPSSGDVGYQLFENKCLSDVSVALADAKACDAIPHGAAYPVGDADFSLCLGSAATKDPAACKRLPPAGSKGQDALARRLCLAMRNPGCGGLSMTACVITTQMTMRDVALCRDSGDQSCALTAAFNTRDRSACDVITDPKMKSACAALTQPL